MKLRIDTLHSARDHNICRRDLALAAHFHAHRDSMVGEAAEPQFLHIEHDIRHILHHIRDILELVLYTFNPNRGHRCARQR